MQTESEVQLILLAGPSLACGTRTGLSIDGVSRNREEIHLFSAQPWMTTQRLQTSPGLCTDTL